MTAIDLYSPRRRPSPLLERVAFRTPRLMEFCGRRELVAQTGHPVAEWPCVVLKELVDNSLDGCEDAQSAPELDVTVDTETGKITVADNGPGIVPELVPDIVDYSYRVSSRDAYVSTTRGAQGNALKTLLAMPFALDGRIGETTIESGDWQHEIVFKVDHLRQQPVVAHQRLPLSPFCKGTRITVWWPDSACSILADAKHRFLQIADDFGWLNPHLRIRVVWDGIERIRREPSQIHWEKWCPSSPTSAHWYDQARLQRYIAAHVARDQDHGRDRTIREFISELRGFSGSAKQKRVLDETGLARAPLSSLFGPAGEPKDDQIFALLAALQNHSNPVKPQDLGLIGKDHLLACFQVIGVEVESYKYSKAIGETEGLPWIVEAAFGWSRRLTSRRIVVGANWSVALGNPFRSFSRYGGEGLESLLADQRADSDEPIIFVLHFACPRAAYTDRGKSALVLPEGDPIEAIRSSVQSVTRDWARQRKAEERDRNAALNRRVRLVRSHRVTLREAAFAVMEEAYHKASGEGTLPTKPRQIMYCARPAILEATGEAELSGNYFSQVLLVDYMEQDDCDDWDIIWDARGHFAEPHTGAGTALGTLEVRQYLGLRPSFTASSCAVEVDLPFPTAGPENRFRNVVFIEKEGFHPILAAARLQERLDVALMSTKGMSVTAARRLLDELAPRIDRIFVLHDFDRSGFSIAGTLSQDSRRYVFRNAIRDKFVDIGLRLSDVAALDLQSEPVPQEDHATWFKRRRTLARHGATEAEINFLRSRRVELNAMTSRQIVDFIEAKLRQAGVQKVIPDEAVLEQHARRIIQERLAAEAAAKAADDIAKQARAASLPDRLAEQVAARLRRQPGLSWDIAVSRIISADGGEL